MEKTRRNRAKTTLRIIDALEEVIVERGLAGIGVNRIAERAGVSKVLIYRYFGGMEGLLEYYIKMGRLFPVLSPAMVEQVRPLNERDLAQVWSRQVIQSFRFFRTFKVGREILKATMIENDPVAEVASKAQDEEMARLVAQLSFIQGADSEAISGVIIGAMIHMTLLAQNNHTLVGIDLRSEEGWSRIEEAVKTIFVALNKLAVTSGSASFQVQPTMLPVAQW
jgi:AcrR family transcriptional regulator